MPPNKAEDKYVTVGKIKTRYWSHGNKGNKVLLIHGIGGSVETDWTYNFKALAARNQIYGLDLVGFGLTDKPKFSYSLEGAAKFIEGFMEALEMDRASLVGVSLGGGIAMQCAIQLPDRVDKLVLVDCVGLGREIHSVFKVLSIPLLGELLLQPSLKSSERTWKTIVYDTSIVTDETITRDYELSKLPGFKKAFLKTVRSGCGVRGLHSRIYNTLLHGLSSRKGPTLIVWGKQDPILPVAHAYVARDKIPFSQLHIFDNCGHYPQYEHPKEFNEIVNDFLSE